ncbi:MAG: hypothetical protein ACKVY0_29415 [Prosthecobacter sp.]|uniref:hypothetical protein n=1 Tax=Prosthecobacter sp. TaxID=1965333 RepID=UPI0039014088
MHRVKIIGEGDTAYATFQARLDNGVHYLTPELFNASEEAVGRLQLKPRPGVSDAERARFRMKIRTEGIKQDLQIPYGYDHANERLLDRLESMTSDNPQFGIGRSPQLVTPSELTGDGVEIFDYALGRNLTIQEIITLSNGQ